MVLILCALYLHDVYRYDRQWTFKQQKNAIGARYITVDYNTVITYIEYCRHYGVSIVIIFGSVLTTP